MNVFRSEDDVKAWDLYDAATADSIRPVAEYFTLFNMDATAKRLTPDYLEKLPEYMGESFAAITQMGDDPYWEPPIPG